jgi:hypothetical protein
VVYFCRESGKSVADLKDERPTSNEKKQQNLFHWMMWSEVL